MKTNLLKILYAFIFYENFELKNLFHDYLLILNLNLILFDRSDRFPLVNNQVWGHRYKFFKEITKHQFRENFFFNRVANLWNSLPCEIVELQRLTALKQGLIAG